jgi:hypothetical protein
VTDFFEKHLNNYDDFSISTKQTALRRALESYYETALNQTQGIFYEYIYKTPNGIFLSNVKSSEFLLKYTTSITLTHLFFEHFVHEILESINVAFSRGMLNKDIDIIPLLVGNLENIKTNGKNRINYNIALTRLIALIENHDRLPTQFQVPPKFHFIKEHRFALEKCASIRNEIIHSGELILNRYAYELLFVNYLIPLINALLATNTRTAYMDRNTACGINVLRGLQECELPMDYHSISTYDDTKLTLRRINHLKELGRASLNNQLGMYEDEGIDKDAIETHHNKPIRNLNKRMAEIKSQLFQSASIYRCPSCGIESLVSSIDFHTLEKQAVCLQCTYTVHSYLGEPSDFGIMQEKILV